MLEDNIFEDNMLEDNEPLTRGTVQGGHEWVDLGLTEMWATCNVGAEQPEDLGDYFAWGEMETKDEYVQNPGPYLDLGPFYDISGDRDDVASEKWGAPWRMPSRKEWKELIDNCFWTWVKRKGVWGYKIVSKLNGHSIFLPATGEREGSEWDPPFERGTYWSSTPCCDSAIVGYEADAFFLEFWESYLEVTPSDCGEQGYIGRSVRPVVSLEERSGWTCSMVVPQTEIGQNSITDHFPVDRFPVNRTAGSAVPHAVEGTASTAGTDQGAVESNGPDEYVDLGLSVKWATRNVGAEHPLDHGDYYAWGETTVKSEYTSENCETDCMWLIKDLCNTYLDVARFRWGRNWRIPTRKEMQELIDHCDWTWMEQDGHCGFKVVSRKNGQHIFLPAAGYREKKALYDANQKGLYWTSTSVGDGNRACLLLFNHSGPGIRQYERYIGRSIRPVST